jgi:threonine dehydrogenase-like Zn-dependent dehydrogenase
VIAVARTDAADRMRAYGAAETVDHTAVPVRDAVRWTHPGGLDVLVDVASDAGGFSDLASLLRPGGTALTTQYVADAEALAAQEVTGVNFLVSVSSSKLHRLADAVVSGQIVVPPITRVKLDDVPGLNGNGHAGGKTVITF